MDLILGRWVEAELYEIHWFHVFFYYLLLGGWNPQSPTQPAMYQNRGTQVTNPPLVSPTLHWCHNRLLVVLMMFFEIRAKQVQLGNYQHMLTQDFNLPTLKLYKTAPENWWFKYYFPLLGWPIFRSNVSFISRWFARFSFTAANIRLGLPRCLTLMNWSSWVRPKFVGSKMSRGLFFVEKVWVYCGKKQRFHSTADVGASPQVPKMFLVNL